MLLQELADTLLGRISEGFAVSDPLDKAQAGCLGIAIIIAGSMAIGLVRCEICVAARTQLCSELKLGASEIWLTFAIST